MSDVTICNQALSHLGSEVQIVSIDPPDGSREAGYAARFFRVARMELIELHNWSFALRRKRLALSAVEPPFGWTYVYSAPANAIEVIEVIPEGDDEGMRYQFENGLIYTNAPFASVLYKVDVPDTTQWTPLFASALSYLLASYLAGPLIRGAQGAQTANAWREAATSAIFRGAASDANQAHEDHMTFTPAALSARQ